MTSMEARLSKIRTLYPYESHFLDLEGVRYHYLDEGSGEVLLMLHGNPTWSFYYRNLVRDLRTRYRVVVPDHIGCGLSDKPQNYNYTLEQHIDNLTVLIQNLSLEKITLLMHDWGGPIGMGYATQNPDNVKRLVIFNTAAFWLPQIPFGLRLLRIPFVGSILIRNLNLFTRVGVLVGCRKIRMTKDVKAGYLAPYDTFANRVGVWRFVNDIPMTVKHPSYPTLRSIEDKLHRMKNHPMIIIWGGKDPVFSNNFLEEWKNRFPGVIVKVIDDAGHYVVEDGFDVILPWVIEFLEKHPISRMDT